ncbi:pentapeptide repeat-containing protein [Fluviicoccus sp.]|uniref:pentapeptide repeat-containing protein n=1 Tax=Fluviicoccus sp. TaxID=2003552 RepID=UPI00351DC363
MSHPPELAEDRIDQEICGLVMEGVTLERNLTGSTMRNCKFLGCKFDRVLMAKTTWIECEFIGSTLISHFNDAEFVNCDFRESTFRGLTWQFGGLRAKFRECNFSQSTFNHVLLRACRFSGCNLEGVRFVKCDVRGTKVDDKPLDVAG